MAENKENNNNDVGANSVSPGEDINIENTANAAENNENTGDVEDAKNNDKGANVVSPEKDEKTSDVGANSVSPEKDEKTSDVGANSVSPEKDEITTLKNKLKDEEDKYKRLLAEFDNYRKRTEKEKVSMYDFGASQILTKILPIIDNIERAIESVKEEDKANSVYEGLDKIYKQVNATLESIDVKPIEALNKKFDANLHNAVMTDEESDAEVDTVTEELQKGYTYKGDVIRHSMVKVKK